MITEKITLERFPRCLGQLPGNNIPNSTKINKGREATVKVIVIVSFLFSCFLFWKTEEKMGQWAPVVWFLPLSLSLHTNGDGVSSCYFVTSFLLSGCITLIYLSAETVEREAEAEAGRERRGWVIRKEEEGDATQTPGLGEERKKALEKKESGR